MTAYSLAGRVQRLSVGLLLVPFAKSPLCCMANVKDSNVSLFVVVLLLRDRDGENNAVDVSAAPVAQLSDLVLEIASFAGWRAAAWHFGQRFDCLQKPGMPPAGPLRRTPGYPEGGRV